MKKFVCEMCGSNDLLKQDEFYVCQNCGTKYTVEEARKMMVEGTVQVDRSNELNNLYTLARRAKNDNNSENAQKYYEQILVLDPTSWEAHFYTIYYQSMNCTIAEIRNAAINLTNCEDTVLKLIKDNVSDPEEQRKAVEELSSRLIDISNMLFKSAMNHFLGIDYSIQSQYKQEMVDRCCASRDICYNFGNCVINIFGDDYGLKIAVPCWKAGIAMHRDVIKYLANEQTNTNIIAGYDSRIQQYDSSYYTEIYNEGIKLMESSQYQSAYNTFAEIADYKDAKQKMWECQKGLQQQANANNAHELGCFVLSVLFAIALIGISIAIAIYFFG